MKIVFWTTVISALAATGFAKILISMVEEWVKNLR
jgi:hypothetical protein